MINRLISALQEIGHRPVHLEITEEAASKMFLSQSIFKHVEPREKDGKKY